MSSAKTIIRILVLIFVLLVVVLLSVMSVNAAFLPGCESCHLVTPVQAEEMQNQLLKTEEEPSRFDRGAVQTEFASHKNLDCTDCHVDNGFINRLSFGARMTFGMVMPIVKSDNFDGIVEFQPRCLSCHQEVMTSVVESRGIRMKHSECAVDSTCAACHATVGHRAETDPEVTFSMDGCMSCHNELNAEKRECDTCHIERTSSDRRITDTSWAITHGPDWERMHGMGEMSSCQTCHTTEMCGRCHGVGVPHPSKFFNIHGGVAMDKDANCKSCHRSEFCSDCHGIEMPHPEKFITKHSRVAEGTSDKSCLVCHSVRDCEGCHAAHIHPGGSIGTIDGVEADRND